MKKEDWETEKPPLFTVEIIYWINFDKEGRIINNYGRWMVYNVSFRELDALREKIIAFGFFLQQAPGRGEIIFPADIKKMLVDLQPKGFIEK